MLKGPPDRYDVARMTRWLRHPRWLDLMAAERLLKGPPDQYDVADYVLSRSSRAISKRCSDWSSATLPSTSFRGRARTFENKFLALPAAVDATRLRTSFEDLVHKLSVITSHDATHCGGCRAFSPRIPSHAAAVEYEP